MVKTGQKKLFLVVEDAVISKYTLTIFSLDTVEQLVPFIAKIFHLSCYASCE